MKKLILFALIAAGVGVLVKNKSEQLKAGAAKVTRDPRVQSALATASEKAGPYAETVKEKAGPYAETVRETVKEKVTHATAAASDKLHKSTEPTTPEPVEPVADPAPVFTGGDPLTDPLPQEGLAPEPAVETAPEPAPENGSEPGSEEKPADS